jgi:hypothetical protein
MRVLPNRAGTLFTRANPNAILEVEHKNCSKSDPMTEYFHNWEVLLSSIAAAPLTPAHFDFVARLSTL